MAEKNVNATSTEMMDREVIRCQVCGLVQYRTRTGNCRRCLRLLPPKVTFVIPTPSPQDLPGDDRQLFENWPNRETVENIGQRIRQLRESRGMTQSQLQARSRVSRSYLSRIESGQMTPSLGTLEKIAESFSVETVTKEFFNRYRDRYNATFRVPSANPPVKDCELCKCLVAKSCRPASAGSAAFWAPTKVLSGLSPLPDTTCDG